MADLNPIILGGGISAGTPFTAGALLRVGSTTPPTAIDSIVFQRTQSATEVVTIGIQGTPVATEKLQVFGGAILDNGSVGNIADNVLIGRGASANTLANSRNVVIGTISSVPTGAGVTENVVIGYNSGGANMVGSSVIVGANNTMGATGPTPTTVVGANNTFNNSFSGPGIGTGASWQGAGVGIGNQQVVGAFNNYIAVGRAVVIAAAGQTVLGDNAQGVATHSNSITIGRNAVSILANGLVFGASGVGIVQVLIGEGDTIAAPANVLHRYTNASGANANGAQITFQASLATGNSTVGSMVFSTGLPAGSSSTLQTATQRLAIRPSLTNGAAVDFLGTTSGAGASAGTLANAPSVGNPSHWLPVLVAGAVRYIPCWT